MTKILVTLPPSYRHFLSVWDNASTKSRNIQTLTQRLLKEENVTNIYNNGQADATDLAFFTNNFFFLNKAIDSVVEDTTMVAAEESLVDQQVQHPDTRMSENVITAATLLISMPLVETD